MHKIPHLETSIQYMSILTLIMAVESFKANPTFDGKVVG